MKPQLEEKIYSTFASISSSIGYSEVHGRIMAALLVSGKQLSLSELSKKTGYSLAAVSLSLDLLELVGIVKKFKNPKDKKLYVRLEGDVLEGLRNALMLKLKKELASTLSELENYNKADPMTRYSVYKLKKEMKRFEKYIDKLAAVKVPE